MQPFGLVAPIMVKAQNLVQTRLISYGSMLNFENFLFETFMFSAQFQYTQFAPRLLPIGPITAQGIFLQSHLFEQPILQLKRARKADSK